MSDSKLIAKKFSDIVTEPTVHLFEITDFGQIESLRKGLDYGDVPLRAAGVLYTAVDSKGSLVAIMPPPGYGVWVRPVEEFKRLFEDYGNLTLPVSLSWSDAPDWITAESPEEELSAAGLGKSIRLIGSNDDRAVAIPLDWTENEAFPSTQYLEEA